MNGEPLTARSPEAAMREGIFYVPEDRQGEGLVLEFEVEDNVTLSILERLSRAASSTAARRARSSATCASGCRSRAPTTARSAASPAATSRRSCSAKALAREPEVLLLDEPTRGVDVGAKAEIYGLIDELARQGKAILVISSEMEELLALSDRVLVMREGRLTGEYSRADATQENVMQAATGVTATADERRPRPARERRGGRRRRAPRGACSPARPRRRSCSSRSSS